MSMWSELGDLLPAIAEQVADIEDGAREGEVIDRVADAIARADLDPNRPFLELAPGLSICTGPLPTGRIPGLVVNKLLRFGITGWEQLTALTRGAVTAWEGAGARNADVLLAFALVEAVRRGAPARTARTSTPGLGRAMTDLAREASSRHPWGTLLDALRQLLEAGELSEDLRRDLESFDAASIAQSHATDVGSLVGRLLEGFDERERRIIEGRLVRPTGRMTLQEIADEFGLTRERIRQLEALTAKALRTTVATPSMSPIADEVEMVRETVGVACPLDALPENLSTVVAPEGGELRPLLTAWLAGPFRIRHDWLVRADIEWPKLATEILEEVLDGREIAPIDAVLDALSINGVHPVHLRALLGTTKGYRLWENELLTRWGGPIQDRAAVVLALEERPLTVQEISEAIPEKHSIRALSNQLSSDPRFVRVAKQTWALAAWGAEEYRGIANSIMDALIDGPRDLDELCVDLEARFGIPPGSTMAMATMGPAFVVEVGTVRLRGDDEPYEPAQSLQQVRDCFVTRGTWAQRFSVDHDVLRGSGQTIQEPLAVELGLHPGTKFTVDVGIKELAFGWSHQRPYLGSLRLIAEHLGALEGDLLFLRVLGPRSVAIDFVRNPEERDLDAEDRIRRLIGSPFDRQPLLSSLADALALPADARDRSAIETALQEKHEARILELLPQALDG